MLFNWLKIALFNYKKNWLSTFINVFGLTLGLTCLTLIIMHWQDEESYESWNPNKNQVYFAEPYYTQDAEYDNQISYPLAMRAKETLPEIEDVVLIRSMWNYGLLKAGENTIYIDGGSVSSNFFSFFPFKIVAGNSNHALQNENSIAISDKVSKKLFGTVQSVGRTVQIEGQTFMVTCVYEKPKGNTVVFSNFITLNRQLKKDLENQEWGNFNYNMLVKLKANTDLKALSEKFVKQVFEYRAKVDGGKQDYKKYMELYGPNDIAFTPLSEVHLHAKSEFISKINFKQLMILFSLSVLIVLLSAINLINLKTAQASQRAKEVGVRKAIGSSKIALISQFLVETFLLCLVAFTFALVLTELLLPSFNQFYNKELHMNNAFLYLVLFGMVLLVSLISGLIPALYIANFKPIQTLKGNFSRSKHGIWLRNGILCLQLLISSFFIIGGMVIRSQVKYMMDKDLGFNGNQILNINIQGEKHTAKDYQNLKNELKKITGVLDISFGEASPATGSVSTSNIDYQDQTTDGRHGAMDFNYLPFMGVKLAAGRMLNPLLASDSISKMIVNEALVRKFGWTNEQAIHKEVRPGFAGDKKFEIVGVVKDFNFEDLSQKVDPTVFFHYNAVAWKKEDFWSVLVKISPNNMDQTVERLKSYWENKVEPGYPFDYYFIDKKFAKTFEKYQKQQTLFTVLNVVVLLVALLGLFALSSLLIEQRLKEVAIRKVLGASEKQIVMNLTKKFLYITLIAVLISMPISYYFMNEWLKDFAYRIEMPIWPYVLSLAMLVILTFLVVSIKAYRATQVNLVKYLKYE